MKKTITTALSSTEYNELLDMMKTCIQESISVYSEDSMEWLKECEFEDYFYELIEMYDDCGNRIGEGLETISYSVVLNDETRRDFQLAFNTAREEAFEEID